MKLALKNTLDYSYGWSFSTRCSAEKLGHFTQRVSMIAAWCQGKVLAPMTFTGYQERRQVYKQRERRIPAALKPRRSGHHG